MSYYLYIIRCSDTSLYTGVTNDVGKRVKRHNEGRGARYTHGRRPVTLVYKEKHVTLRKAMERERQIKGWSRKKKIRILKLT